MYDVLVLGAGPAGAMAARTCAERGLDVLLADAARFPRDKTCAGGLTLGGIAQLPEPLPEELAEWACSSFRAVWFGEVCDVRRQRPYVVSVDRSAFDHWLVRGAVKAGAKFRDGERVIELVRRPDSILAITSRGYYRARAVIGCDGVNSLAARRVRGPGGPARAVLTACAEVTADEAAIERLADNGFRVEYGVGPVGYSWALPKRGRLNIGVGALGTGGPELGRRLAAAAQRHGLPAPAPRFHMVPLGHRDSRVVADNILLAGDAASLTDPFSGEGLRYALASGKLAAAVLADVLARGEIPDRHALAPYETLCAGWREDFRAAWRLVNVIGRHPHFVQRLAFDNDDVFQRLLDLAEGNKTYRQLFSELAVRVPLYMLGSARAALVTGRSAGEAGI